MLATSLLVRQTINAYVYHTIAAVLFGGMFLVESCCLDHGFLSVMYQNMQ